MTEDEAKTRWCPFARLNDGAGNYNRCGPAANLECIGSACMTWRWSAYVTRSTNEATTKEPKIDSGYCGLAGRP